MAFRCNPPLKIARTIFGVILQIDAFNLQTWQELLFLMTRVLVREETRVSPSTWVPYLTSTSSVKREGHRATSPHSQAVCWLRFKQLIVFFIVNHTFIVFNELVAEFRS